MKLKASTSRGPFRLKSWLRPRGRFRGDGLPILGQQLPENLTSELAAAYHSCDIRERSGPRVLRALLIRSYGFDIEANCKSFLRRFQVQ